MQLLLTLLFILTVPFIQIAKEINIPGDYSTIQAGIDIAVTGDTVLVAEGTYYENINFKGKAITVASHFIQDQDTAHISKTIIDGSQHSHPDSGSVVYFISGEDTTSVLCGFTITGGTGTKGTAPGPPYSFRLGGGIMLNNSGAAIRNNLISQNQINSGLVNQCGGGGIVSGPPGVEKFLIIENNIIAYNSCSNGLQSNMGAGLYILSSTRIVNNTITNNYLNSVATESAGGGILLAAANAVTIKGNTITGNKALTESTTQLGAGGGMYLWDCVSSEMKITNNIVADNEIKSGYVADGAGISFENCSGDVLFANNLVYRNYFSGPETARGGGIYLTHNSDVQIINNTVYANDAIKGGGICSYTNSIATLINNILWDNNATTGSEIYMAEGGIVEVSYSNIQTGWTGTGNITSDPMFTDVLFHLSDSSRCIGAGTIVDAPGYDFEGNVRPNPAGSKPDMGAMENERAYPLLPIIQIPDDYSTIQAGIDAAENGDTVLVAEGTYYENINFKGKTITVASHFVMDKDTSHISKTIIDGSQPGNPDSGSVIYMIADEDTTSVLCGFTVTGGTGTTITFTEHNVTYNARVGGGIYIASGRGSSISWNIIEINTISTPNIGFGGGISAGEPPTSTFNIIENNIIRNNSVSSTMGYTQGGAIFMGSNGRICDNIISENTAYSPAIAAVGGAIRLLCPDADYGARFCLIDNNIIRDNQAISETGNSFGGGVMSAGIRITLKHNQIIDNVAKGHKDYSGGGGLYIGSLLNGQHIIDGNLFSGNTLDGAYYGGGIALYNSAPRIINNIIISNSGRYGGGLFLDNSSKPEVINNTFYGNNATSLGGGIYSKNSTLKVLNTILWNNTAISGTQIYRTGGASTKVQYTIIQDGWDGEDASNHNWNLEPLFADAENGDCHLLEGSPGIGWGLDSSIVPKTDYYGNIRPHSTDANVDMGAIESPYVKTIIDAIENDEDKLPSVFALSQNYPNPFNPITTIEYQLPKSSQVELSIYNLLGQKVAALVSEKQPAGTYNVQWDAAGFASGIYMYKLETDKGFVECRKLILLK